MHQARSLSRINFFLGGDSVVHAFSACEKEMSVRYVVLDPVHGDNIAEYDSISVIPNIGISESGTPLDRRYLIVPKHAHVVCTDVVTKNGARRTAIDQADNRESLELCCGGVYKAEAFIAGYVATGYKTTFSSQTLKIINDNMRNIASRKMAYWIDGEALACMHRGMRLTTNVQIRATAT